MGEAGAKIWGVPGWGQIMLHVDASSFLLLSSLKILVLAPDCPGSTWPRNTAIRSGYFTFIATIVVKTIVN